MNDCWVNGHASDSLPVADRGLQYGDGVFRTLRRAGGEIEYLDRHLDRLAEDAARLGIAPPPRAVWGADLAQTGTADATIKLILTRGVGGRGYMPPEHAEPTRIVQLAPVLTRDPVWLTQGVVVTVCEHRLSVQPVLAGIKHLNRLDNVLARRELAGSPFFDGFLLDADDWVVEATQANLLAEIAGEYVTPMLDRNGVRGVMRDVVIDKLHERGQMVRKARLTLDDLRKADRIWLTNSLIGQVLVQNTF